MPKYQVVTFQRMAPTRPAKMIGTVTVSWSTMPLAIVAATVTEMNAPTKLRIDASPTATRGRSARVAIVVAIAFAVSWKPLVKSKTPSPGSVQVVRVGRGDPRVFERLQRVPRRSGGQGDSWERPASARRLAVEVEESNQVADRRPVGRHVRVRPGASPGWAGCRGCAAVSGAGPSCAR